MHGVKKRRLWERIGPVNTLAMFASMTRNAAQTREGTLIIAQLVED